MTEPSDVAGITQTASPAELTLAEQPLISNAPIIDAPPPPNEERTHAGPMRQWVRAVGDSDLVMMSLTLAGFLILLLGGYGIWLGGKFFVIDARMFDVYQNTPSLLLSVGLVACLACGQFDLSAGGVASLSMMLTIGLYLQHGIPLIFCFFICIAIGVAFGLVNGLAVARFRVHTFIATLAMGGVADGLSNLYSSGSVISETPGGRTLPSWFAGAKSFGSFVEKAPTVVTVALVLILAASALVVARDRFLARGQAQRVHFGVAGAVVVAACVALFWSGVAAAVNWQIVMLFFVSWVLWAVMRYTPLGRKFHATGMNPTAARLSGIRVQRVTIFSFVLSGVFASLAGICLAANQSSATPGAADGYLLPAFAAVFLSTVILSVGRFNVWGTIIGGICLVYVGEGFAIGGLQFSWSTVIDGVVLLLAVALSSSIRRNFRR